MRTTCLVAGLLCVAFAVAGVFLPLLPATPFALLGGWLLARSSPRAHAWLLRHPVLGPTIRDWNERGAIRPPAKALAAAMVLGSILWVWTAGPVWLHWWITPFLCAVIVFVLTRPHY